MSPLGAVGLFVALVLAGLAGFALGCVWEDMPESLSDAQVRHRLRLDESDEAGA